MDGPVIEYRLLGPIEAVRDGLPLAIGGPRQRSLLALLLVGRGQYVSGDRLVDELWAGEPPGGAPATLRSYVSRLRASLGGGLVASGPAGYRLDIPGDAVDAVRFERLVRDGDEALRVGAAGRARDSLAEALGLWHGEPFGGEASDGSLQVEGDRLAELRLHAIESRIEADLALGRSAELVDELEVLVHEHPYREHFWRQLMLALYRSERQADALAAYRRARNLLRDEMGIDPSPQLDQLQGAILRREVPDVEPTTGRPLHNLPAPLTSFVGRASELASISRLLVEHRLLTLTGVGGVGKTRLAIEAASRVVPQFKRGVWFVDLAPLSDAALVPTHVAHALGVQPQPDLDVVDEIVGELRDAELLLVFDNCEHLRDPAADICRRLLAGSTRLRILVTSRENLGVPGEAEYSVQPMRVDASGAGRNAELPDALRLFVDRARAVEPGLADDDATLETIARICADLDGLPLAIELAAARVKALSVDEIGARLADRFQFLVSWRRLATTRHRTLREAMDWSYDLLADDERGLLAGLSVFAGGFTLEAVAAVCLEDDDVRALRLVERMVDASLVVPQTDAQPTRYRLLETVRQYAAEKLTGNGDGEPLRRRHGEFFLALAEAAWVPSRRGDKAGWLPRLAADQDNLRAALRWAWGSGEDTLFIRIAEALWRFWWFHGDAVEGRAWLDMALEHIDTVDPGLAGRTLTGAAGLAWVQGDWTLADALGRRAYDVFAELDSVAIPGGATDIGLWRGSTLNTLALVAEGRDDFAEARRLLELALVEFDSIRDPEWRDQNAAIALHNLGSIALDEGDFTRAEDFYTRALARFTALGDGDGVGMCHLYLGWLEIQSGHPGSAREHLAEALEGYAQTRFLQYLAQCLDGAALVSAAHDGGELAVRLLGAGAAMRTQAGHRLAPKQERVRDEAIATLTDTLGEARFEGAWNDGLAMPPEQAVAEAREALAAAATGLQPA